MKTLNEVYSTLRMRRRYEVWFLRLGLADGAGGWWFRYLLMNPGRGGCPEHPRGMPVQVWATWFPRGGKPLSFIQGFSIERLDLSARGQNPFHFRVDRNQIDECSCRGDLALDGHEISWDLRCRSTFRASLSEKGWVGFSRSPHSDAFFSGRIRLDERRFEGDLLGFGVQGHNCGYRHRSFWIWTHVYFLRSNEKPPSTLEALTYDMPLGLTFRKAVLWHDGEQHVFRNLRQSTNRSDQFVWNFNCSTENGFRLEAAIDGTGPSLHRLPYLKTNCSGSLEVMNNSLAKATLQLSPPGKPAEILETTTGAVLEMSGQPRRF